MMFLVFYAPHPILAGPADPDAQLLMAKMERADQNQQKIRRQLGEIQNELYVVKIRATRKIKKKPA